MDIKLNKKSLDGIVYMSPSKSIGQRALAASLLRRGKTILHHLGKSDDVQSALKLIQDLGAQITFKDDDAIFIDSSVLTIPHTSIHFGESGLAARMFLPIIALSEQSFELQASGSLLQRPIGFWDKLLPELNVTFSSNDGYLPASVQGPLQFRNITIDASDSSQNLTGILMAYASDSQHQAHINVVNLTSKHYIDLTLEIIQAFGLRIPSVDKNYTLFSWHNSSAKIHSQTLDYIIGTDWSNAAFWMVGAAIGGNITIKGLDVFSHQGDKAILTVLQEVGAKLSIQVDQIQVSKDGLRPFYYNATHTPDLFPPLAILAARCKGLSAIDGVHRLNTKESNREESLLNLLTILGVKAEVKDDKMMIEGSDYWNSGVISSYNDHRIAMAAAIASLNAVDGLVIQNYEAVYKSYPDFFDIFQSLT